jgi:hypothetical protein
LDYVQRPCLVATVTASRSWRLTRQVNLLPLSRGASWERPGVAQFRQPHNLSSRFRMISDQELPGLTDDLLRTGCVWVDYLDSRSLPPTITDRAPRPGDEAIRFVTGRRPIVEWAVAAMAHAAPNVTIHRGTKVRELITGASAVSGVPHVAGVRTTSGEEIRADLVIDAMGRRSPACEWILSAGVRSPIEEAEDSSFVYFTRYFSGNERPRRMGRARSRRWACSRSLRWTGTTTPGRSPCIPHRRTRRCEPSVIRPRSIVQPQPARGKPIGSTESQ